MALGTLFGGWRIVKTMGMKITKLKPVGGFCAETARRDHAVPRHRASASRSRPRTRSPARSSASARRASSRRCAGASPADRLGVGADDSRRRRRSPRSTWWLAHALSADGSADVRRFRAQSSAARLRDLGLSRTAGGAVVHHAGRARAARHASRSATSRASRCSTVARRAGEIPAEAHAAGQRIGDRAHVHPRLRRPRGAAARHVASLVDRVDGGAAVRDGRARDQRDLGRQPRAGRWSRRVRSTLLGLTAGPVLVGASIWLIDVDHGAVARDHPARDDARPLDRRAAADRADRGRARAALQARARAPVRWAPRSSAACSRRSPSRWRSTASRGT